MSSWVLGFFVMNPIYKIARSDRIGFMTKNYCAASGSPSCSQSGSGNGLFQILFLIWFCSQHTPQTITSFPTAREGNVFRGVCHSVHRGERSASRRECCLQKGVCLGGGLCLQDRVGTPSQYWHLVAATAAVDTHPNGMHSWKLLFLLKSIWLKLPMEVVANLHWCDFLTRNVLTSEEKVHQ